MDTEGIRKLIEEGHLSQAKEEIQGTEFDVLSLKAVIAVYEENYLQAEKYLIEGIAKHENDMDLLFNMGIVQQVLGNYEMAINYYEQLLQVTDEMELVQIAEQKVTECKDELSRIRQPLVSIVLLAYNKLEYTKMCVESIFRHTSHLDFELIAVNNGSTDDTFNYFNELPHQTRSLHLPRNRGVVGGFNAGMKIARGKYTAAVCNDFIFTPRWLDNLLLCIESDEKIGYVSPGASSISNHQQISGNYSNLEELEAFAEQYNHSDPLKWEERVRLLPNVLMARTELLKRVDYYDPRFYYGEFADDDISFKIRRAGYKLVYCRDTFTHHFGSVTVSMDQLHNNSMHVSRQIFQDKYGFDSWEAVDFHPIMLESFEFNDIEDHVSILGINANCGGNPLQLKNMLRSVGVKNVAITNYCSNPKYKQDLETVSERVVNGELGNILSILGDDQRYTFIVMELKTEYLQKNKTFIHDLKQLLKINGQIACRFIYNDLNEKAMASDIEAVKTAGYEVKRVKVDANVTAGYDVLITAQWRG